MGSILLSSAVGIPSTAECHRSPNARVRLGDARDGVARRTVHGESQDNSRSRVCIEKWIDSIATTGPTVSFVLLTAE